MDYRLENLSEDDFERLVNRLCQRVLGTGTVSFLKGKDGGRDGRFEGTANNYPSCKEPWKGKFIIQAKHTSSHAASCTDKDFFSDKNKKCVINEEIPKIIALKGRGEVDNYLLFTNRKESEKRENAVKHIKAETGLNNVDIIGKETLHSWLLQHRDIAKEFKIAGFAMPFDFYDKDIRDVIVAFHGALPRERNTEPSILERPNIEVKNKINQLDKSYFDNIILDDLNRYHSKILDFLQNPINAEYAVCYEETAQELKRVIETNREDFDDFKKVFDFLTKYLTEKEPEKLRKYRNIIPVFFHFMYYQCDIGREK
jgi:hypothetical protein